MSLSLSITYVTQNCQRCEWRGMIFQTWCQLRYFFERHLSHGASLGRWCGIPHASIHRPRPISVLSTVSIHMFFGHRRPHLLDKKKFNFSFNMWFLGASHSLSVDQMTCLSTTFTGMLMSCTSFKTEYQSSYKSCQNEIQCFNNKFICQKHYVQT